MKRILYVRHGKSTNINGVAGVSDAQLTEKGAEQAKIIGQHLKTKVSLRLLARHLFVLDCRDYRAKLNYPVYEIVYD